jgi:CheY-like chemotaxis protein
MSKRILVVEDQDDNRQIIRDMLAPTDYEITPNMASRRLRQSRNSGPISS